jgi:hypothetical protein
MSVGGEQGVLGRLAGGHPARRLKRRMAEKPRNIPTDILGKREKWPRRLFEEMKKSGKTESSSLSQMRKRGAWKKRRAQPVYEDAAKRVTKSLIDEFEKEVQGRATN